MDDDMEEQLALSPAEAALIDALIAKAAEVINIEIDTMCKEMPFGEAPEWAIVLLGRELAIQRRSGEPNALRSGLLQNDAPAISVRKPTTPKIRGHLRLVSSASR